MLIWNETQCSVFLFAKSGSPFLETFQSRYFGLMRVIRYHTEEEMERRPPCSYFLAERSSLFALDSSFLWGQPLPSLHFNLTTVSNPSEGHWNCTCCPRLGIFHDSDKPGSHKSTETHSCLNPHHVCPTNRTACLLWFLPISEVLNSRSFSCRFDILPNFSHFSFLRGWL